jgi:hypothetical protein
MEVMDWRFFLVSRGFRRRRRSLGAWSARRSLHAAEAGLRQGLGLPGCLSRSSGRRDCRVYVLGPKYLQRAIELCISHGGSGGVGFVYCSDLRTAVLTEVRVCCGRRVAAPGRHTTGERDIVNVPEHLVFLILFDSLPESNARMKIAWRCSLIRIFNIHMRTRYSFELKACEHSCHLNSKPGLVQYSYYQTHFRDHHRVAAISAALCTGSAPISNNFGT